MAGQAYTPPAGAVPLHNVGGETYKWDAPGKQLEGIFAGLEAGSMGGKLLRIQTGKGIEVASAPTQLERALAAVSVGSRVVIIYKGEVKTKSGRMVKSFEAYALPTGR